MTFAKFLLAAALVFPFFARAQDSFPSDTSAPPAAPSMSDPALNPSPGQPATPSSELGETKKASKKKAKKMNSKKAHKKSKKAKKAKKKKHHPAY